MKPHLVLGTDYYLEDGKLVFTSAYHLKRGFCCNSGCRHCPYRDGSQPEVVRVKLRTAAIPNLLRRAQAAAAGKAPAEEASIPPQEPDEAKED